jgi:HAE1 family hydrophobic/amphiphilic exporter-1
MAVAIIGGTITSTLLTLLVVPTFYDAIEISRDRAFAKFRRRLQWRHPFVAFVLTFVEAILTLLLIRFSYRMTKRAIAWARRRGGPVDYTTQTGD